MRRADFGHARRPRGRQRIVMLGDVAPSFTSSALTVDPNDITSESVTPAQQSAWQSIIASFESKAAQFAQAMSDLQSQDTSTYPPDLLAEYQSLMSQGNATQSTIATVQQGLQDVKNALVGAWSSVTGFWQSAAPTAALTSGANPAATEGMSPMTAALLQGMGGLGFLPLIPIAIVAASVAALAYFLSNYAQFSQKVALLKQGYTPAQIAQATATGGGLTGTLGALVWIAAGIAAVIFLPKLIGQYRSATR